MHAVPVQGGTFRPRGQPAVVRAVRLALRRLHGLAHHARTALFAAPPIKTVGQASALPAVLALPALRGSLARD
jgi:hypothetical protein